MLFGPLEEVHLDRYKSARSLLGSTYRMINSFLFFVKASLHFDLKFEWGVTETRICKSGMEIITSSF